MPAATRRLALPVCLLLMLLAAAAGGARAEQTLEVAEGVLVEAHAGDTVRWTVAPGAYFYVAAGGRGGGAHLDESDLGRDADVEAQPHEGHGGRLEPAEPRTYEVRVKEGTARLVLARPDLEHGTSDGQRARLAVDGTLAPGECRAYVYYASAFGSMGPKSVLHGTVNLTADGEGVEFRFLASDLETFAVGVGRLTAVSDPETAEGANHVLQACNPPDAPAARSYRLEAVRDRVEPTQARVIPGPAVAAPLVALVVLAAARRRA